MDREAIELALAVLDPNVTDFEELEAKARTVLRLAGCKHCSSLDKNSGMHSLTADECRARQALSGRGCLAPEEHHTYEGWV